MNDIRAFIDIKPYSRWIITKSGEGDMLLMSIDTFEKREQILELRSRVLQAEQERLSGAKTMSVSEAGKALRERLNEA